MEYKIVWTGANLPSKKNSKQLRKNFKTWARFISSSDAYHVWEESFVLDIKSLRYSLGKVDRMELVFYAPDRRKFDLTNKAESINDGLVKAGFLNDDNYVYIPEISLKFGGVGKGWKVEMTFEKTSSRSMQPGLQGEADGV